MAIYFSCSACGQPLYAQEIYHGMETSCPVCKARNTIPPLVVRDDTPLVATDLYLVDMETWSKTPEKPAGAPPITAVQAAPMQPQGGSDQSPPDPTAPPAPPPSEDLP